MNIERKISSYGINRRKGFLGMFSSLKYIKKIHI